MNIEEVIDPRLRTPSNVTIHLTSTLDGVILRIDGGPRHGDPLGQNQAVTAYKTLDGALLAVAEQVRLHIHRVRIGE